MPTIESTPEVQIKDSSSGAETTYGQILKSSTLVGGAQVLNIGIGIVRTKAMAVLLGPGGFGLFGLYSSVINVVQSIAGMGLSGSGVRQIATAVGSGDTRKIALTTTVLRKTAIVFGLLGALLLVTFSRQVSEITFGTVEHAAAMRLLSLAVLFQIVSWGQDALVQGMRRIADLAKMQVLGALFGTILTIPIIYFWRENGVVPSLVVVYLMYLAVSWRYSRKINVLAPSLTISRIAREVADLLKLGVMFMSTGFMTLGLAYAVRLMVLRSAGIAATGYYQSAWTLGGLYVGVILQAMGADFYPRLTAVANDNITCNRLVNEQAQVGFLLGVPGVIATLTIAPLVITMFYSAKFGPAVGVLRWICLGAILQVITWPMGFILIAKGRRAMYFTTQLAWTLVSLGLACICVKLWGLDGAGIAFFASYIFFGLMEYQVVARLSDFRWSDANMKTALIFLPLVAAVFGGFRLIPFAWAVSFGVLATIVSGVFSIRTLLRLISWEQIPRPVLWLLVPFRFVFSIAARNPEE